MMAAPKQDRRRLQGRSVFASRFRLRPYGLRRDKSLACYAVTG